jgi:hypothetical protein
LGKLGLVAPTEEMITGMLGQLNSLVKGLLQLASQSCIAGLVDRVFTRPTRSPLIGAGL